MFCTFHCPILSVWACGSLVWCALASLLGLASFGASTGCTILEASWALFGVIFGLLNGALELGRGTVCWRRCLVACLRVALRGFKARGRDVRLSARRGPPPEGGRCPRLCRRASPAWSVLHSAKALRLHLRYSRLVLALRMPRGLVEGGVEARVVVLCFLCLRLSPRRSCLR